MCVNREILVHLYTVIPSAMVSRNSSLVLFFGASLLLFFTAVPGRAQQVFPESILLSRDILKTVFPESAQIESADRIGDVTLVVWGSARKVTEDSVANVLYWQMLRGTEKMGEPELLSGSEHQPCNAVQVLALGTFFQILWDDCAEDTVRTLYRTIDTGGVLSDVDELFEGETSGLSYAQTLRFPDGRIRVYYPLLSRTVIREYDGAGELQSEVVDTSSNTIADVFWKVGGVGELGVVLRRTGEPEFFDGDGGKVELPDSIRSRFETETYYLDEEFRLYQVAWPKVLIYEDVFDAIPEREFKIEIPNPSGCGNWEILKGSSVVIVDSAGVGVQYGRVECLESSQNGDYRDVYFEEWLSREDGTVVRSGYAVTLASFYTDNHSRWLGPIDEHESRYYRQCRKTYVKDYHLEIVIIASPASDTYAVWPKFGLGVRADGMRVPDPQKVKTLCNDSQLPVKRLATKRFSTVEVDLREGKSVDVAAPLPQLLKNVREKDIVVSRRGDDLYVSWLQYGDDTVAEAYVWEGEKVEQFDRLVLDSVASPRIGSLSYSPILVNGEKEKFRAYGLSGDGWFELDERGDDRKLNSAFEDLDDDEFLLTFSTPSSVSASLYSPSWELLRRWDSIPADRAYHNVNLLSMEDSVLIGISYRDTAVFSVDDENMDKVGVLPFKESWSRRIYPYYDHTFLVVFLERRYSEIWHVDRNAVVLDSVRIDHGTKDYYNAGVVFNPDDTGSGFVLFRLDAKKLGVFSFDRDLNHKATYRLKVPIGAFSSISGSFRNDTLYMAWDEAQKVKMYEWTTQVYANAIVPPIGLSVEAERKKRSRVQLVSAMLPNPAGSEVRVELLHSEAGSSTIEVWGLGGELYREVRVKRGEPVTVVPVDDLAQGLYLLKVRSGAESESRILVIAR